MFALLTTFVIAASSCGALPTQLAAIAQSADGRIGASLKLLETGETTALRGEESFPSQSTYKIPIAMAALQRAEAQKWALDKKVRLLASDVVYGPYPSPARTLYLNGTKDLPLKDLVYYAIANSDNTASDALLRLAGGPAAVNAYVEGLGVRGLKVGTPVGSFVPHKNLASPTGMVSLLALLHDSPQITPAIRLTLLTAMHQCTTGPGRIKGLLPATAKVAHKTGTSGTYKGLTTATNDVGLITLPDGRHLAIAVYVANSHGEASAERTIAQIARAAWDCWTAR